jgi:hypothetical protein
MKCRNLVAIGLVALACTVLIRADAAPKMAASATRDEGCWCITMDCIDCNACVEMYPECFCYDPIIGRTQFCFPNECGEPSGLYRICDADWRIEDAAASCWLDAIQRCQ